MVYKPLSLGCGVKIVVLELNIRQQTARWPVKLTRVNFIILWNSDDQITTWFLGGHHKTLDSTRQSELIQRPYWQRWIVATSKHTRGKKPVIFIDLGRNVPVIWTNAREAGQSGCLQTGVSNSLDEFAGSDTNWGEGVTSVEKPVESNRWVNLSTSILCVICYLSKIYKQYWCCCFTRTKNMWKKENGSLLWTALVCCVVTMHTVPTTLAAGKDAVNSTGKAHTVTMTGFSCLVLKWSTSLLTRFTYGTAAG